MGFSAVEENAGRYVTIWLAYRLRGAEEKRIGQHVNSTNKVAGG